MPKPWSKKLKAKKRARRKNSVTEAKPIEEVLHVDSSSDQLGIVFKFGTLLWVCIVLIAFLTAVYSGN